MRTKRWIALACMAYFPGAAVFSATC
jgi:hypothetical protein